MYLNPILPCSNLQVNLKEFPLNLGSPSTLITLSLFDEFDETHGLPERFFGYDQEETTTNPPFIYPDIEVDTE